MTTARHPLALRAVVAATWIVAASAVAEPVHTARLGYRREPAAERCPDELRLRAAVASRLGYDPFRADADIALDVEVRRAAGRGLQARIELADRTGAVTGARRLSSPRSDCEELASALVLAISLAIDPTSLVAAPPSPSPSPSSLTEKAVPTEPTPAKPEPRASVSRSSPVPDEPPSDGKNARIDESPPVAEAPLVPTGGRPLAPPTRTRILGSLGVLAALGTAASVVVGFSLQLAVRRGWWSIGVEGRGDLPAGDPTVGSRFSTSLVFASLVPCAHLSLFSACALLAAGGQVGSDSDSGASTTRRFASRYLAAGGRVGMEIPWGLPLSSLLAIDLHADILAPLSRATVFVDGVAVSQTPGTSGDFAIGLIGYFR